MTLSLRLFSQVTFRNNIWEKRGFYIISVHLHLVFICILGRIIIWVDLSLHKSSAIFVPKDITNRCTGPIWFSFTVKLLLDPVKLYYYFNGGYLHLPNRKNIRQKIMFTFILTFLRAVAALESYIARNVNRNLLAYFCCASYGYNCPCYEENLQGFIFLLLHKLILVYSF